MADTENSTSFNTTSFPLCSITIWNLIMVIVGMVDCVLSLPSLPWALWVLMRYSHSLLEAELFIFNVLCSDVASILINLFSYLNIFVFSSPKLENAIFVIYVVYLNGHPLFQCSVCFEQYMAVVHPFTFRKYKPMRYKVVLLCLMWLIALVFSMIYYNFIHTLHAYLAIVIPVVCVQSFCSLSILKVLRRDSPGNRAKIQESDKGGNNLIKKRAFVIVVILQIKLLVNYLPFIITCSLQKLFLEPFYNYCIIQFCVNICFFGRFIHSFLYLQKVGRLPVFQGC